jgi:hypothetical protein
MIKWMAIMCSFMFIQQGYAQQLEGYLSVDSRTGYSTNTLLTPFFGEWDRTSPAGYGYISPMGMLMVYTGGLSVEAAAGGVFESFTGDRQNLFGGYGMINARFRINDSFSAGIETGGSAVTTSFDRTMYWAQPVISWSPTLFTRVNARTGSSFRFYGNGATVEAGEETEGEENELADRTRFDLYGLELETWPNFRWKIRAGLYGDLSAPSDNLNLAGSVEHQVNSSLRLTARAGMDQYRFQFATQNGPGGGPPIGGPPGTGNGTVVVEDTDRIFRIGVSANYQVHRNVTLFAMADQLSLNSSGADESIQDYQLSAGARFTIRPSFGGGTKAEPDWRTNGNQVLRLKINYSGDGQLYLIGDFNDWEHPGVPLSRQDSRRYVARLSLDSGAYEYKILLIEGDEEKWIEFTDETITVRDGFGGENGLLIIE